MKKILSAVLAVAVASAALVFAFTGCGRDNANTGTPVSENGAGGSQVSGTLNLTGSTSMADVCNALTEKFMEKNPDVNATVGGNGSGEAPTAVDGGTAQIGLLSRELKESENPGNYNVYQIGLDGIAIVVNPENGVSELTVEQIGKIYTGEITNWKELGGADLAIVANGREAASGTRGAFEEIVKVGGEDIVDRCQYANEYNSTGALKQAVAGNPGAIGYVSLSSVDDTVKAVTVEGVAPSEETVKDGSYKIQRPFIMITGKNADSVTKAFLEFVASDEGQQIILDDGVVPTPITVA
ncbi:MAG TPA: phosphate ABC transporter substrate-binding protein [Candidatus Onthovicinus excrementipullorum]|nr:phosphate ABC transporter substrate-binding protein [Candidatus Onthovicinus excrementipullorum]